MQHVLVLGDQLTRQVGPLATAKPSETSVLMVESLELARALVHHKQKLILFFSAMRHFAEALRADGFTVVYKKHEASFESGVVDYLKHHKGATLTLMEPNDVGYPEALGKTCKKHGGTLQIVTNELWLTDKEMFAAWVEGRKELRMEYFYREVRKKYGYLLDDRGDPEGGQWNFDKDNREKPEANHTFPEVDSFEADAITNEVIAYVDKTFPNHFGQSKPFRWAVTREQALEALHEFCKHRLKLFGKYEDAMMTGQHVLYHSLLSPVINMGLLHPKEVVETALNYYDDKKNQIPLNSMEGFVRQVIGWREFMKRVYDYKMPAFKLENKLSALTPLPEFYWTGNTKMNCLRQCVTQLRETGHTHHIQRLMVLGNFAQIAGVNPQELTDWFTATFIDALEWVMVPNVVGMSQYANLGSFTSKPYGSSGNYINKMSDYCKGCHYNVKEKTGEQACPFNSLYWDFINRHLDTFSKNQRMGVIVANWKNQKPADKKHVLERAGQVKKLLADGEL
jgi:deoxyribodipyrimidine photolyase-related protein